jgi:hypothetical protein
VSDLLILNEIREAIGDELINYGFTTSEPNDYGLRLEDLG